MFLPHNISKDFHGFQTQTVKQLRNNSSLSYAAAMQYIEPAEQQIANEFELNRVIQDAPTDNGKRQISLSVRVKGKKAYEEWDLRDVLQNILHKSSWSSLSSAPRLNLDEFDKVEVSDDALKLLIDELQKNADVFGEVTRNEMTCREYISPFLTAAVKHSQLSEPLLALRAEDELNGSRGFGPMDYTVILNDIVICVTEAKKMDFDEGAAQNIVQMHSAVESLSKRKREDTHLEDSEEVPVMVYGIVSNARNWLFLQWAGTENDPYMKNSEYNNNGSAEYRNAIRFLEIGCKCGCSKMIPREKFAELREAFQALSRSEQDIFLMAQLKAKNGGEITASQRHKKKMQYATLSENVS
ncbi:hypothetical protein G9A89_005474 [Geosiphon pyriformis]|nr:hypothetical protein G9A89_005474 [Geosiphon pyriformis]